VALLRPLSPPVGEIAPDGHGLRGVYANDKDGFTPTSNTRRIYLREHCRCLKCDESALYLSGAIGGGTGYDAEWDLYLTCANCGAQHRQARRLELYTGRLPWHILE